eukprot:TRINITY_DN9265_c1_g1_i2.p1 TRINITY_DN9265_c1_g1~~TRINITY_DN9265_c1_g1_i2.p1  ORF type:complete len:632 (+),score=86.60 TRINITY_DN9265_c1_g1_i2:68-1963(+)
MIGRLRTAAAARKLARWCSDVPSAAERGAGLYHSSEVDSDLLAKNAHYAKGAELLKLGSFGKALTELELARETGHKYDPSVLMLTARCLMEQKRFEEAKKLLQLCSANHAGRPGLSDMLEEVDYGIELWGEHLAKAKAKQDTYKERMKQGIPVDKYQVNEHEKPLGHDILGNLPMENHQRDYFRKYIGKATDSIGMYYTSPKGRCIAAKRRFEPGETLFKESTVLFAPEYLSTTYKEDGKLDPSGFRFIEKGKVHPQVCSHCQGSIQKQHQCTDCGLYYCSNECQVSAATSYHNVECKVLRNDAVKAVRDKLVASGHFKIFQRWLTMIRCTAVSQAENGKYANQQPWFNHLAYYEGEHKLVNVESESMESHKLSPTIMGVMAIIYAKLVVAAVHGAGVEQLPKKQYQEYLKDIDDDYNMLYDRVKSNVDKTNAIYPFLSMVNHSCMPNAEFKSPGHLVATEPIPKNAEICVSYSPPNVPLDLRYHWLEKNRGFTCTCLYCLYAAAEDHYTLERKNDASVGALAQNAAENRQQWSESEELTMPDGKFTKKGIESFTQKSDDLLSKYPTEFRETMLRVQENIADELKGKSVDEVRIGLTKKKEQLDKLRRQGLAKVTTEEAAAFDVMLDSITE